MQLIVLQLVAFFVFSFGKHLGNKLERVSINKHITFHCARNTFYVLARHKGVDDRTIQDIFGHSMPSTTNVYKKIENEDIKNEMNKMNS